MIKVLSNDTIQKIAAGEVVERPASIIKELVENSIDANSKNIIVEIKNGGKTYIKVSDDGDGIPKDDVELAFERHATSKIDEFDDLYTIYSMGFRGEALASIVSVSKVIMKTKILDQTTGVQVVYDNNALIEKKDIGMNKGTSIEVFDLFKYIPVRQKFLNSDISESNKISELMYIFAIGNPGISFTYIKDNREVFRTNTALSKILNYETLFGKDFMKNNIDIFAKSDHYIIKGNISNNKYYKGNRSMQFLFVNNRYIESENISQEIEKAYQNMIPQGRFPVYEIKIEVDPSLIDINIHPNKQKIKFSYLDELLELINETLTSALYNNEKSKVLDTKEVEEKYINFQDINEGDGYKKVLDAYKLPMDLNKDFNRDYSDQNLINFKEIEEDYYIIKDNKIEVENTDFDNNPAGFSKSDDISDKIQIEMEFDSLEFKSILLNRYMILEDALNSKLKLVDINRANQRIIYDREINNDEIKTQSLLTPLIIELTTKEIEIISSNKLLFEELGFEIDQFDDRSIAIRSIPYYFDEPSSMNQIHAMLDDIENEQLDKKDYLLKKSLQIANSKPKIINEKQSKLLLNELNKTSNPNTSPFGKSIIFEIEFDNFIKLLGLN
ncbi:DNA mismatch repair endonuclease MutL [Helcococcus sueciensis]|uniref:DNA mismatch repair endonuclease MutL n=1 Tax=Helcococcus sueciensis TaxID=241555 RepID=UPI00040E0908|nr:DNA mismatch repair endonuclease MutL [Helcococcus sueciensis]